MSPGLIFLALMVGVAALQVLVLATAFRHGGRQNLFLELRSRSEKIRVDPEVSLGREVGVAVSEPRLVRAPALAVGVFRAALGHGGALEKAADLNFLNLLGTLNLSHACVPLTLTVTSRPSSWWPCRRGSCCGLVRPGRCLGLHDLRGPGWSG